ncbi:DUF559 domain-containing protein [Coleofasciculus sp. FACHB-T130]|nr:DUF559 domain-containing protein [Coleofasciculus sp. FACHB-T130]
MTQGNLRDEYCPARIYQCTTPNQGHIQQLSFTDGYLREPSPPEKPELIKVEDWKPIWLTVALCFFLLIPRINVLAFFGLMGIWAWAFIYKFPNYKKARKEASIKNQRRFEIYKKHLNDYQTVRLPKWEKDKEAHLLKQKEQKQLTKVAINEVWKQKSWRVHSQEEIQITRAQGFIGPGEDQLFNALSKTSGIYPCHQVQIEPYYTADIVCLNLETGKLCVVEVDGNQHWLNDENINKDNRQMAMLADIGVPTIRFINNFAKSSPYECVPYIQELLS